MMRRWRQYWRGITPRERRLTSLAAGSLVLALCYYLVWLPWQARSEQWQRAIAREQQTVGWMLQQAPRVAQAPAVESAEASRQLSLPVLISQSSSRYGLTTSRLQPQGNQVSVTLARSDFTLLLHWLGELEQQGVSVVQLDVAAVEGQPGRVDISKLVLERRNES